jgi:phosphatidylserine/phosphatidylglycerophosphate/cardiolipin synthase-like enzyme
MATAGKNGEGTMNHFSLRSSVVAGLLLLATILPATAPTADIEAYFSPHGGCAAAIVTEIEKAQSSILVQIYSISQTNITAALIAAHARGVNVSLVVDRSQTSDFSSSAPKLFAAGVPIVCDQVEKLNHNKSMVIDNSVVITGSFNFSESAESKNAENLLVIHDPIIAAAFSQDWKKHHDHSATYYVVHAKPRDRFKKPSVPLPPHPLRPH